MPQLSRPLGELGLQQAVPLPLPRHTHASLHPTQQRHARQAVPTPRSWRLPDTFKARVLSWLRGRRGPGRGTVHLAWPSPDAPACEECGRRPDWPWESCHPPGSRPALTQPGWAVGWEAAASAGPVSPAPPAPLAHWGLRQGTGPKRVAKSQDSTHRASGLGGTARALSDSPLSCIAWSLLTADSPKCQEE